MCPENDILSAYYDNELDGDFKSVIEQHLSVCGSCRNQMDTIEKVGTYLRPEEDTPLMRNKEYIKTRVFEYTAIKSRRDVWKQRIMIPVPLAITAIALVCFLIGGSTFLAVNKSQQANIAKQVNSREVEIQTEELAILRKLLESNDVTVQINMQIPEQREIKIIGEPQMLTQQQRINFIEENE